MSECRRCGDCIGADHHWMDELTFDPRLSPTADPVGDRVCKHCPVVGMTCEECDGFGMIDGENEAGQDIEADCPKCEGVGILIVPGVIIVEDEDGTPVVKGEVAS